MVDDMRVRFPGLLIEPLPSGRKRLRVRVDGDKARRITLNVPIDHPALSEHYSAARIGIQLPAPDDGPSAMRGSIGWLVEMFQAYMEQQVKADMLDIKTQKYRVRHTNILRAKYGEFAVNMPSAKLQDIVDSMMDTPSAANTFIKSVRAMYKWGKKRGYAQSDPTVDVDRMHTEEKGATPWTVEDLAQYRDRHPPGTMAHLYLTLLTFTACRIEDARSLGRGNEYRNNGVLWLKWQPAKKNSQIVDIPMAPQLIEATRAQKVMGQSYILSAKGKPFASKDAMGNRARKWFDQAGLHGRSSHGVRKAAGSLLAESGMSQHVIMAIHGHSEARTSERYTKGAQRRILSEQGLAALGGLEW